MCQILERDIIQANPLIEARKEMTVTEMRLFLLGLQDIKPHIKDDMAHDVSFRQTIISCDELKELFGNDAYGNIANMKKKVEKASRCIIKLSYKNGGFCFGSIYKIIRYEPSIGLIIQFSDVLKPYILDLVNQPYTKYKVKALFGLSSTYAWHLLESLLENQGYFKQGRKKIYTYLTIKDIRFRLNAENKYINRIDSLKKNIIDIPIKEINEKTDYFVWYEIKRKGRKIIGFRFWLKLKKAAETETAPICTPEEKKLLIESMLDEGMTKAAINTWIKDFGIDAVVDSWRLAIDHANNRTETHGKGTQRIKYLKACMEKNIASVNADEAAIKAEIDEREKRVAAEKEQAIKDMQEGFEKIDFACQKGNLQSVGSLLGVDAVHTNPIEPQELTETQLMTIREAYKTSGAFTEALTQTIGNYGYTENTFVRKYWKYLIA